MMTSSDSEVGYYKASKTLEWLRHVRDLRSNMEVKQKMVEERREMLDGINGVSFDIVHSSSTDDKMLESVLRLQRAIEDYAEQVSSYVQETEDAVRRLGQLERSEDFRILVLRYVLGRDWHSIAEELCYSRSNCMKIHRRALEAAYDVMPTDWRDPIHKAI